MQVSYIIIKNNVILHAALIATYDEANVVEFFQLEKTYWLFFNMLQGF